MKPGQYPDTAILLFVREEKQEAVAKPLLPGRRRTERVFAVLNRHTRKQLRATGLPCHVISGSQQEGASFGERLVNAFESLFARGYQRVLAVGNDCPDLNAERLLQAAATLQQQSVVLGPASDGGVYLIGLDRTACRREQLLALPWQTQRLCEALQQYALRIAGGSRLLSPAADIDRPADLRACLLRKKTDRRLRRQLLCLLGPLTAGPAGRPDSFPAFCPVVSLSRRGPPAVMA